MILNRLNEDLLVLEIARFVHLVDPVLHARQDYQGEEQEEGRQLQNDQGTGRLLVVDALLDQLDIVVA